jgi:hypothetical protein
VPDAIEGETLKMLERTGGETSIQNVSKFNWSGDAQLWWIDGKPGDRLVLEVPVPETGRYRVTVDLTKAVDYGIVQLTLADGAPRKFDRYHPAVANDALELGTFDLDKGPHRLSVEILGANEKAIPRHMFGIDYLKLDKADERTIQIHSSPKRERGK